MSDSRHPKDYVEGPRKQMTRTWKERVIAKLAENEKADIYPRNLAELARKVGADKRGIYVTFDLDADKPQTASAYVDAICSALDIEPPLQEPIVVDDELERELDEIRRMPIEQQRALLGFLRTLKK